MSEILRPLKKALKRKKIIFETLLQEKRLYHVMLVRRRAPIKTIKTNEIGPVRESNPGPLAPKARIMPLDQQARQRLYNMLFL